MMHGGSIREPHPQLLRFHRKSEAFLSQQVQSARTLEPNELTVRGVRG